MKCHPSGPADRVGAPICVLLLLSLVSCGGEVAHDPYSTDDTCELTIDETYPGANSIDAYVRDPIEFHLSEVDPEAWVVADMPGVQTSREEGRVVVFTPDEPLSPLTSYTFGLEYCRDTPEIQFTTSDLGLPIEDIEALEGETFLLDLSTARFREGAILAEALTRLVRGEVAVQIIEVGDQDMWVRAGIVQVRGDEIEQDTCFRTLEIPEFRLERSDGFFSYEADLYALPFYEGELNLSDFGLEGTVAADSTELGGGRAALVLDARDFSAALNLPNENELCDLTEGMGSPCVPCEDGGQACLELEVEGLRALLVDGSLALIGERNAHEDCEKRE